MFSPVLMDIGRIRRATLLLLAALKEQKNFRPAILIQPETRETTPCNATGKCAPLSMTTFQHIPSISTGLSK